MIFSWTSRIAQYKTAKPSAKCKEGEGIGVTAEVVDSLQIKDSFSSRNQARIALTGSLSEVKRNIFVLQVLGWGSMAFGGGKVLSTIFGGGSFWEFVDGATQISAGAALLEYGTDRFQRSALLLRAVLGQLRNKI